MQKRGRGAILRRILPVMLALALPGGPAAAQAFRVKDIFAGPQSSAAGSFARLGNVVLFHANDGVNGSELWRSDGSAGGTSLVKDIRPGPQGSNPRDLTASGSLVFLRANDLFNAYELWRSNGTAQGTFKLADRVDKLVDVNGTLFFTILTPNDTELWKTDGSVAGTRFLQSSFGNITELVNVNGTLFFAADSLGGYQLWKSDGTAGGTVPLKEISAPLRRLTKVSGTLFFSVERRGSSPFGLWKSDGTPAGTVWLKVVECFDLAAVGPTLFFRGLTPEGGELWKSDGTEEGTVVVKDVTPGGLEPTSITDVGGTAFFSAYRPESGRELWKSDGTAEGTVLVADSLPGELGVNAVAIVNVNGRAYYDANDGVHGRELWKSDGTPEGTALVQDINPGAGEALFAGLQSGLAGELLFFGADDGQVGYEVWALGVNPSLSIADVSVTEGDSGTVQAAFQVTLSRPSTETVTVRFATADGTAAADGDYFALSGTLSLAPGQTTSTVGVSVRGDNLVELDEVFFVDLDNPTNAAIADARGMGTILNDDFAPGYGSTPPPPGPIAFGPATVGTTVQGSFVVRETGGATLVVSDPILAGTNPGDFAVVTGFPLSIPDGGASRTVELTCTPSAPGLRSATLTLATNDPTRPAALYNLSCTGLVAGYGSTPPPPGPIGFGSARVGTTVPAGLEIRETGDATLVVGDPTLGGADPDDFEVLTGFPLSIADGDAPRSVELACTPSAVGLRAATLTLTTNDPERPTVLYELTCTGVEGLMFHTVNPCRVLDTRTTGGPLAAGQTRTIVLAGSCGISPTAKAVSITLSVTQPSASGNIRLFPAGTALPTVSSLNYRAAMTRGNNAIVGLGDAGSLAAFCDQSSGTAHLILDVNGYFE